MIMEQNDIQDRELSTEDLLSLMDIYYKEWQYRDEILWKQVYRFFYVTVIVLFLPNIAGFIGIVMPDFPCIVFPVISLIMACFFFYAAMAYVNRLKASSITYRTIMEMLPKEYQRIESKTIKYGKHFQKPTSAVVCTVMFVSLILISCIMFIYYLRV